MRRFLPLLAVLLLWPWQAGCSVQSWRSPQPESLAQADSLLFSGQYYAALQQYSALARAEEGEHALVALRLGIVRTIRGEFALAEDALWRAISRGLAPGPTQLANLYLGHVLASRGQPAQARQIWQRIENCQPPWCGYLGPRSVLQAEWALQQGDYQAATQGYRQSFGHDLPAEWRAFAVYRLALVQATADSARALALLKAPPPSLAAPADPLLRPLLPTAWRAASSQLYAVLQAAAPEQHQLLGQFYLSGGFYDLALAQFEQVPAASPYASEAAVYALYARWQRDHRSPAASQMPVSQNRQTSSQADTERAEIVLSFAALTQHSLTTTNTLSGTIGTMATLSPYSASTHLAWALWYIAHSDYVRASSAYQQALALAPPAQRGRYALLIARFHLNTAYERCSQGRSMAEAASERLPASAEAWATLAGVAYQCADFAAAVDAARQALEHDPQRADAQFYLGAALARSSQPAEARAALIRAADLAPASSWRERAERLLAELP